MGYYSSQQATHACVHLCVFCSVFDDDTRLSQCIYLYRQLLQTYFFDLSVHLRHIGMHPSFLVTQVK